MKVQSNCDSDTDSVSWYPKPQKDRSIFLPTLVFVMSGYSNTRMFSGWKRDIKKNLWLVELWKEWWNLRVCILHKVVVAIWFE